MLMINVNGRDHDIDVDPATPLLWILREQIGLTGTKFGCGIAQCGACTVHMNGQAVRSCVLTMSAVDGAEITTIEGLDPEGAHPLQIAWAEHNVPQCGFCQAGQIMNASAMLAENPNPTDQEILDGMSGNICRCGCYERIVAAVRSAATGS